MNFEYKYQISNFTFFPLLNIYFHKVSLIFSQNKDINVEKMSLRVIKNMYVHGTHLRKFVEIEFQSSCETYYTFDEFNTSYYVQGNKMHVFALTARHILALSSSIGSENSYLLEDFFVCF